MIPRSEILGIITSFRGIVVVDEAYIDFASEGSLLPLTGQYPNLVILQTFSKARGLAALRLGLAFGDEAVIKVLSMVKYPYNINASTQKLALEAIGKPIDEEVATIRSERGRISEILPSFSVIRKVYPSEANFILVKVDDADRLYGHLLADGIIVRNRTRVQGCRDCLRITVGLPDENEKMLKSLSDYEKGNIRR